jgi:hypothetical protein
VEFRPRLRSLIQPFEAVKVEPKEKQVILDALKNGRAEEPLVPATDTTQPELDWSDVS